MILYVSNMLDKRAKKDNFARETCNGDLQGEIHFWRGGVLLFSCVR